MKYKEAIKSPVCLFPIHVKSIIRKKYHQDVHQLTTYLRMAEKAWRVVLLFIHKLQGETIDRDVIAQHGG